MTGKHPFIERITPQEALTLFAHAKIQEFYIAKDLYDLYIERVGWSNDRLWDLMRILALIFDTGRVQGIREERAARKA